MTSRRDFLKSAGLYAIGFAGLRALVVRPLLADTADTRVSGYGPLAAGPANRLRLPAGFHATFFSRTGEEMDDRLFVPGRHDGMAAFSGPDGRTFLVRNHEVDNSMVDAGAFGPGARRLDRIDRDKLYDLGGGIAPRPGGTTTLLFNTQTQQLERHFLSLGGTVSNCAGGPTPWGTWISCEETEGDVAPHAEKLHGYNFEVIPSARIGLVDPVPLKAMGRFRHEAVAVDPNSGIVYQTEDLGDGLLYRFIPEQPGRLAMGGKLQALALIDRRSMDTRNWKTHAFPVGEPLAATWLDLEEIDNPKNDLRLRGAAGGAAIFARAEGAWWGNNSVYFAMTSGGRNLTGQIFRYRPSIHEGTSREKDHPPTLELFVEPNDTALLNNCDNLTVAPWGDLIICEDTSGICRVVGITPAGNYYVIAASAEPGREFAGVCFSPDGTTLFVNVQNPGYTVAITGPWNRRVD